MLDLTPSARSDSHEKSVTVLLAEDEMLVRLSMADVLRSAGYTVLEAANADEARVLLANFAEIALLFSDIQMPGTMDGAGLARFVRATYPAVAVILTSGSPARGALAADAPAFVPKPYVPEDIVKRIGELLN